MEAVNTSETSVSFRAMSDTHTSVSFYQTTRRNMPEDSHLQTRRRENLKSQ
jgi:hypothetical protein